MQGPSLFIFVGCSVDQVSAGTALCPSFYLAFMNQTKKSPFLLSKRNHLLLQKSEMPAFLFARDFSQKRTTKHLVVEQQMYKLTLIIWLNHRWFASAGVGKHRKKGQIL